MLVLRSLLKLIKHYKIRTDDNHATPVNRKKVTSINTKTGKIGVYCRIK
jgi:hypothetical protein